MERWLAKLRALPFSPLALEMLNAPLAQALGLGDRALLLARLGGNDDSVRAQLRALGALGEMRPAPEGCVARARGDRARRRRRRARLGTAVAPARALGSALRRRRRLARARRGARGIVRCIHPASATRRSRPGSSASRMTEGTHIFERLPASRMEQRSRRA